MHGKVHDNNLARKVARVSPALFGLQLSLRGVDALTITSLEISFGNVPQ